MVASTTPARTAAAAPSVDTMSRWGLDRRRRRNGHGLHGWKGAIHLADGGDQGVDPVVEGGVDPHRGPAAPWGLPEHDHAAIAVGELPPVVTGDRHWLRRSEVGQPGQLAAIVADGDLDGGHDAAERVGVQRSVQLAAPLAGCRLTECQVLPAVDRQHVREARTRYHLVRQRFTLDGGEAVRLEERVRRLRTRWSIRRSCRACSLSTSASVNSPLAVAVAAHAITRERSAGAD
jgi:hypothetical protein